MNTDPDIATYILNRPRGQFSYSFNFSDTLLDLKSPDNAVPVADRGDRQTTDTQTDIATELD